MYHLEKEKWLTSNINYSEIKIKNIIEKLYNILLYYITKVDILDIKTGEDDLFKNFTDMIYKEYVKKEKQKQPEYTDEFEYLDLHCSSILSEVYLEYQDICKSMNIPLFTNKCDNSYPLLILIYNNSNVHLYNDGFDSDESINDENNESTIIHN